MLLNAIRVVREYFHATWQEIDQFLPEELMELAEMVREVR